MHEDHYLPALPHWYVIFLRRDADGKYLPELMRSVIMGWHADGHDVRPLVVGSTPCPYCVVDPSGAISDLDGHHFESENAALEYMVQFCADRTAECAKFVAKYQREAQAKAERESVHTPNQAYTVT